MSPRRLRLDAELVRRGLARSREQASELILAGRVKVSGNVAAKPATAVGTDVAIVVLESDSDPGYVSRGAHKLAGALAVFEPMGSWLPAADALTPVLRLEDSPTYCFAPA